MWGGGVNRKDQEGLKGVCVCVCGWGGGCK